MSGTDCGTDFSLYGFPTNQTNSTQAEACATEIRRNYQGIYELTGNKPGLRDAIRRYFIARQEDGTAP